MTYKILEKDIITDGPGLDWKASYIGDPALIDTKL